MGDEKEKEKKEKIDERFEFFNNYVMKTLRLKNERWVKLMGMPESKVSVWLFLDFRFEFYFIFYCQSEYTLLYLIIFELVEELVNTKQFFKWF